LQTLQIRTQANHEEIANVADQDEQIKYSNFKTRTSAILGYFKLDSLETRTKEQLAKFTIAKRNYDFIASELATFKEKVRPTEKKLQTAFDKMLNLTSVTKISII